MTGPSTPNTRDSAGKGQTRQRLLRAAEGLFAEQGIARTSTRAILQGAGQRNESALQYHFGGREGLIEALYIERGGQIAAERERMMAQVQDSSALTVRELCEIALLPPVHLARQHPEMGQFLKVVGQLAFLPSARLQDAHERYEFGSVAKVGELLRKQLDLPEAVVDRRLLLIHRLAAVSLAQRARADRSFEGPDADLYFGTVLDAMAALLSGPVSKETQRAVEAASQGRKSQGRKKTTKASSSKKRRP